jgi:NAD(P)-dependent dehydrogenase (short-subunit alcohol dehydrogenase family)
VSKAAMWSATDSMRTELATRGVQVVGVYVGYVDTDMAAGVEAPKTDAADVVNAVLDAVEAGEVEVLADETSRAVRAHLGEPIHAQLARLSA